MLRTQRADLKRSMQTHAPLVCLLALLLTSLAVISPAAATPEDGRATGLDGYPIRDVPIPSLELLGPNQPAADPELPTSPPPDPQVGDSWLWWLFYHHPMPPHFEQRMCTVRGKADRGYVIVEDTQWEINIFQDDVDVILERWENSSIGIHPDMGIYEIDSLYFGDPPDELDNDPRIYLMWFDIGSAGDGFFFYFDQYPDGTFPGFPSNECETLYLNCAGTHGPSSDYMISVAAHEFEHLIHWKYDENEDTWVDEGMAELAMWFYGRPDVIAAFNSNPDNPLTQWDGTWADYIQTYLWSLYFYERYGGGEAVYALVHEPLNSINGYEATLDAFGYEEDVADVFADWAVANFLDDPSIGDGRFGYLGDDLPPFNVMGTYTSYPVPDQYRTVNHWATDYYRFENLGEIGSLLLGFDGADNNVFAVWGLTLHSDGTTDVLRMPLDPGTQSGTLGIPGLGDPNDEVILVVAGTSSQGTTNYAFNAESNPAGVAEDEPAASYSSKTGMLSFSAGPNPSRGEVLLQIDWEGTPAEAPGIEIYDAAGRLVRSLSAACQSGKAMLTWDGHDGVGRPVPPGVYYARASAGGHVSSRELIVIR